MAISTFEALCAAFCELAAVPTPSLDPDEEGSRAFHVNWRDVAVTLLHVPDSMKTEALVLFEMGPIEEQKVDAQIIMGALLDFNFMALRSHGPTFSRNPATGEALLHCTWSFDTGTAHSLHTLIEEGIRLVHQWRENFFIGDDEPPQVSLTAPEAALSRA